MAACSSETLIDLDDRDLTTITLQKRCQPKWRLTVTTNCSQPDLCCPVNKTCLALEKSVEELFHVVLAQSVRNKYTNPSVSTSQLLGTDFDEILYINI
jgi:hypothetical protein